jgi:hypothetical protein
MPIASAGHATHTEASCTDRLQHTDNNSVTPKLPWLQADATGWHCCLSRTLGGGNATVVMADMSTCDQTTSINGKAWWQLHRHSPPYSALCMLACLDVVLQTARMCGCTGQHLRLTLLELLLPRQQCCFEGLLLPESIVTQLHSSSSSSSSAAAADDTAAAAEVADDAAALTQTWRQRQQQGFLQPWYVRHSSTYGLSCTRRYGTSDKRAPAQESPKTDAAPNACCCVLAGGCCVHVSGKVSRQPPSADLTRFAQRVACTALALTNPPTAPQMPTRCILNGSKTARQQQQQTSWCCISLHS